MCACLNYTWHFCNISLCLSSFCSQLFCLHLSPPPQPLDIPLCLSLTFQPSSLFTLSFYFFPPLDMLPGCVAETSDLSRGIHGQHPCLLFSLFPLFFLPQFIHPSFPLLLVHSLVSTSFFPSVYFFCSPLPLQTLLFSPWFPSFSIFAQFFPVISLVLDNVTFLLVFLYLFLIVLKSIFAN